MPFISSDILLGGPNGTQLKESLESLYQHVIGFTLKVTWVMHCCVRVITFPLQTIQNRGCSSK